MVLVNRVVLKLKLAKIIWPKNVLLNSWKKIKKIGMIFEIWNLEFVFREKINPLWTWVQNKNGYWTLLGVFFCIFCRLGRQFLATLCIKLLAYRQLLKLSLVNSFILQLQQLPGDVNSVVRPLFKMMPLKSVHD